MVGMKPNKTKESPSLVWLWRSSLGFRETPRATPGVLLHNRLDWQGLVLGVSR